MPCGYSEHTQWLVDQEVAGPADQGRSPCPGAAHPGTWTPSTSYAAIPYAGSAKRPSSRQNRVLLSHPGPRLTGAGYLESAHAALSSGPFLGLPLGSGFARTNPVLGSQQVRSNAQRLGRTPAQIALARTLGLAPNVLLIPGTSSVRHLEENLPAVSIELDQDARQQLAVATQ
jgi:hypothetical protein